MLLTSCCCRCCSSNGPSQSEEGGWAAEGAVSVRRRNGLSLLALTSLGPAMARMSLWSSSVSAEETASAPSARSRACVAKGTGWEPARAVRKGKRRVCGLAEMPAQAEQFW